MSSSPPELISLLGLVVATSLCGEPAVARALPASPALFVTALGVAAALVATSLVVLRHQPTSLACALLLATLLAILVASNGGSRPG